MPSRHAGGRPPDYLRTPTPETSNRLARVGPAHEPILRRHVSRAPQSPDREAKEPSRWGAVPPPGVDRHGVPPADEPRRPRAHPEHHAGRTGPRLARVPGRRGAAERPIPRALRARRPPAAGERRARNTRAVGAEGPAEDVRDVPRRPRAGVVGRAPRPLGRRDHVPAPHPPRPAAFRAITTLPQPAACTRWLGGSTAFAVLPAAVHGCRRVTVEVTNGTYFL